MHCDEATKTLVDENDKLKKEIKVQMIELIKLQWFKKGADK